MDYFLPYNRVNDLLQLIQQSFRLIGPTMKDQAIIYQDISHADHLPWGVVDEQNPGEYRLSKSNESKLFSWVNGPQGIKPQLFKPKESLWRVTRDDNGKLNFTSVPAKREKVALFGVRPCDIRAMAIQDKVFVTGEYQDTRYQERRKHLFIVAANCVRSSNNCFCVGAGGYPKADKHFDIALTDIDQGLLAVAATKPAQKMLEQLNLDYATQEQQQQAEELINTAAQQQTKALPQVNLRQVLFDRLDHPQWDKVADRCLSCGNCTQVCPTCFCSKEEQEPSLDGQTSEQVRTWDSCFSTQHSYIHGKVIRNTIKTRYRQWLTHKVGSWHEQFGEGGCVGCGRCITWCPVGIDITEELDAICGEPENE